MSEPPTQDLRPEAYKPPASLDRLQSRALIIGVIGVIATVVGAVLEPSQFFRSYLVAFTVWFGVAAGCLAIDMVHRMSHGKWGVLLRRPLEAGSRTLPYVAILFIPLLFGLKDLYVWARPEAVAKSALLQHQQPYLNVPFFEIRLVIYFVVFSFLAYRLAGLSRQQDQTRDFALDHKMQVLSAPGLILYSFLVSFAGVDWFMSIHPSFYSTIFGFYFIIGQAVTGLAFAVIIMAYLSGAEPIRSLVTEENFHDWGKLLLAFTMVWAYFVVSQLIIIWSGNLPDEISFYLDRTRGDWYLLAIFLAFIHFFIPFALLLSRDLKRNPRKLAWIATLLFVAHFFDLYWLTAPEYAHHLSFHWLDLFTMVGVGGIWVWLYLWQLKKRPIVAVGSRAFEEALAND